MEELEYLELRQKLKENFRNKMKKELGTASSSQNIKSCSSKDNFGSFFGPSQLVIAQRVIQESKSLLENLDLATNQVVMRKNNNNNATGNKVHSSNSVRPKSSNHAPKVVSNNGVKTKIQMLKYTRDYSFLLSDDVPAPSKASLPPQKSSAPKSDSPKNLPLKSSSSLDVKKPKPNLPRRPNPSKLKPSISKQALLVQKKMPQESSKPKMIQKRVVPSSRPQIKQPPVKNPAQRPAKRTMRWDEEEEEEEDGAGAISMIRQMFRYNPNRYSDDDNDDDSDMEAGFDDILKEEERSAQIARKEDEEELRKIEEEERREQMRRQAKKRKMIN